MYIQIYNLKCCFEYNESKGASKQRNFYALFFVALSFRRFRKVYGGGGGNVHILGETGVHWEIF